MSGQFRIICLRVVPGIITCIRQRGSDNGD